MSIIISKDDFEIIHEDERIKNLFKIQFKYNNSENLLKSITKTNIILGSTATNNYQLLLFKAFKVQTFKTFLKELEKTTGTKKISIRLAEKMAYNLASQLNYLIKHSNQTFLFYTPENIIVINENTFINLSMENLIDIDTSTELCPITYPFQRNHHYISPELSIIKELPSFIHYKSTYYSLACLLVTLLVEERKEENGMEWEEILDNSYLKETKIYWLLKRALNKESKKRSLLLL
jgi:hypothetical protein